MGSMAAALEVLLLMEVQAKEAARRVDVDSEGVPLLAMDTRVLLTDLPLTL